MGSARLKAGRGLRGRMMDQPSERLVLYAHLPVKQEYSCSLLLPEINKTITYYIIATYLNR